jgi:hypothetical protein
MMFSRLIPSKGVIALLAASAAAVSASTASANFSATVVSDSGDTHTLVPTPPSPNLPIDSRTTTAPIYGTPLPTVTLPSGGIKIEFANPSPAFSASASSATYQASEFVDTDGRVSILLHFDTPISLVASISESGNFSTTGSGSVNVLGGGVAIEAIDPIPAETEIGSLGFVENSSTTWNANATIAGFVGLYTDYQLTIDNDLFANAPAAVGDGINSATISKNDVTITINPPGTGRTPEPASVGILALGGMGLIARRRK